MKPEQVMAATVSHDGTDARFIVTNSVTKWRASTLFTKEPGTIQWIDSMRQGDVLWDVGANVGGYSVWASRRRGVKVVAFEPEAQNYALLCRNLMLNEVDGVAYCLAASDADAIDALYVAQPEAGGSCNSFGAEVGPDLKDRKGIRQGAVSMRLDALPLPPPTHIKIDVDGFEHKVIAGAEGLLRSGGVKSVLIEVNTNLPEHVAMVETMGGYGYEFEQAQVDAAMRKEGSFKGCAEYIFRLPRKTCAAEAHLLRRIAETPITMEPFPHMVVTDAFPPDFYAALRADLPSGDWKSLEEARGTAGYPERSVAPAPKAVGWMRHGELRDALDAKFGVKSKADETLLLRDATGYSIPPHTDTPSKCVTALFYLPADDSLAEHGTCLFAPKIEGFTCKEGRHYRFDAFDKVAAAPFLPNTAIIFARTDNSFHGVEPFDKGGVRDILLYDTRK